jgi:aconitate hydratase A / 2-methylisocitrate dehydratase
MNPSSRRDPFGVADELTTASERLTFFRPSKLEGVDPEKLARRPRTIRILLENLVRRAHDSGVDRAFVRDLANGRALPSELDVPFYPARVLLQDFTGIPVLVDLGAMRSAARARGIDPARVNPSVPVDLVIDHSVQVDSFRGPQPLLLNLDREFGRNHERYRFLKWAPRAFHHLRVVPPGNGIVHQVNLEYLATVVASANGHGPAVAFPDTLVGTDSHTTMVNGLGVLAWGVGGIEAESVMLGEPTLLPPIEVVGVRLTGRLPEGATATDVVLELTRALRAKGVVEKFVEFYGPGVAALSVPDRATISNMCPEYGATSALFPIDDASLEYLRGTGRDASVVARVEAYAKAQGWWPSAQDVPLEFSDHLDFDLGSVVPTVAGPKNPEESMPLPEVPASFRRAVDGYRSTHPAHATPGGSNGVRDGSVVIAAITSCTNTSNPVVMLGAGMLARNALARGLKVPSFVKTSLAPGSKVVTSYLDRAGLMAPLDELGFHLVGYGCTTCIGNSGPLPPEVAERVQDGDLYVAAVLSGNRNFEARIHNQVRANYLASPLLVVAYALAGRVDLDLSREPLGQDAEGKPVYLREIWPAAEEVRRAVASSLNPEMFRSKYREITVGDPHWNALDSLDAPEYPVDPASTYLRLPPYFDLPAPVVGARGQVVTDGRILVMVGDRVTTDHISPAGEIPADSPAGRYLKEHGVPESEFNTYGARRGNHEVMVRGTFANVRLRNQMAGGKEGGWTTHQPSGELLTIYDAALRYQASQTPLLVIAGASYGQGSSRDWAAKGPLLLGVRAVLAESYERIHRSNLVGMGVLPLEFDHIGACKQLGLTGSETIALTTDPASPLAPRSTVHAVAVRNDGSRFTFDLRCRIDGPAELAYYRAGGLLPFVLGKVGGPSAPPAAK